MDSRTRSGSGVPSDAMVASPASWTSHSNAMPIFHSSGQWTWDYENVHFTQTGTGQSGSATGEGGVAGIAFPAGATGSIGMNQEVVVAIQQGQ